MKVLYSIKESMSVRKVIGLLLFVACVVFLIIFSSQMQRSFNFYNGSAKEEEMVTIIEEAVDPKLQTSLIGNQRVEQSFTAQTSKISKVFVSIANPESAKVSGEIKVSIVDAQDREVASTSLPANMTANNAFTPFSFKGDTEQINQNNIVSRKSYNRSQGGVKITKNETYKLVVESIDVQSATTVAVNGNAVNRDNILNIITYVKFHYLMGAFFAILLIVDLFLLLWPEKPIKAEIAQWIAFALTPFAGCFIMFKIAGIYTKDIVLHFLQWDGWLNVLLAFVLLWVLFTLINRVGLSAILTIWIIVVFSITNYTLIVARNAPLAFNDLFLWKTAAGVAKSYSLSIDKFFVWGVVLAVFWTCLILAFEEVKGCKTWRARLIPLVASFCIVGGTFALFRGNFVGKRVYISNFNPTIAYRSHGYLLGFTVSIKNSFVHAPKEYRVDKIKDITDQYESDEAGEVTAPTETNPNIIVVMNEAYSDLSSVGNLQVNKDVMPFLHSLKKNTIKGTMHTSVYGGLTANTEFEFLTGHTIRFLPLNSVPYKTMIRKKIPSFAWDMHDQGYAGNIAFHPGMNNSYGRDIAYPNLGFDRYISVEEIEDYEKIRDYMSDRSDYEVVRTEYERSRKETDKPFFCFNVTIQNHGGYLFSKGVVEGGGIEFVDQSQYNEAAIQYLNLVKISDDALKGLITYFEHIKEPTVIVFFGDHQPNLEILFYSSLFKKTYSQWSLADMEKQYHVPFIIWANYDIEEESDVEISANYLHAFLMQKTGGKMTGYDKYLLQLRESIPVITNICYYDDKGQIHSYDEDGALDSKIKQYEQVQYNAMFDKKNRQNQFFCLK